ncbi:protein of unknown function [Bizionia echini]|uniref:DUF4249 domain-containing protein n=1 Tax=Bizionia echini TaxID=649333 RepID=A0A1I5BW16_9FLAO|nr:DUF4249 domain-containing protein [Bizionia echini]SFN78802.1 protein of unknown function [Bizionia echini]
MKQVIILLISFLMFSSCEDVIDVEVPTSEPKLVIDASINWIKGTSGNEQSIKLTLTAPYFESSVPPANNAEVWITDEANNTYEFMEDANTGVYKNSTFVPILNTEYNLTVVYENEIYTATETLLAVADFDFVEQDLEGGITGEETEIKAYFTDPADEENYYFFEFIPSIPVNKTLDTFKDEFVNGNQIFGFYVEEDLTTNDTVIIRNHGVSERFYEFMFILLQQTGTSGGGPFETQPATVRGNCKNISNPENFPLGYFRLSEVSEITYVIE